MGVWRFSGRDARRLPLRIQQGWRVLGFRAGRDTVVLGVIAMERQPGGLKAHKQYVRARGPGNPTIISTRSKPSRGRWDVNAAGDLAFIQDSAGVVAVLKAKRKTAEAALTEPGVRTLCFCGPDLCTVAEGVLRRHTEAAVGRVAEVGDVGVLSSTAESVAWSALVDGRVRISVQALAGVGSSPTATTPM